MNVAPVLFLVFNRPDTTKQVFEKISQAKPAQLFIAADGPRPDKPGEIARCEEVKQIIQNVTWPCEVKTLFREHNAGCGPAVSGAIDWFFSQVEKGIILEDDCLPDASFFAFASAMLDHYDDDERIMHICGSNKQCGIVRGKSSYYFSQYPTIWGWASWRRAWNKYSFTIDEADEQVFQNISQKIDDSQAAEFVYNNTLDIKYDRTDTWDYQWTYAVIKNGGLSVVPNSNLIENIGFNTDATHTNTPLYWYEYSTRKPIRKIVWRSSIEVDTKADYFYMSLAIWRPVPNMKYIYALNRIKSVVRKIFS